MCDTLTLERDEPHDYGKMLYAQKMFSKLFPDFEDKQKQSAEQIWCRVLSRCGSDPALPHITRVVDYGCGEGSFLNHLTKFASKTKLEFYGLDCSPAAIEQANRSAKTAKSKAQFSVCDPCPDHALRSLFDKEDNEDAWGTTALLIMAHTWFHFDQQCLTNAILDLRPSILLVDVYSTWDSVVSNLSKVGAIYLEHGRPPEDGKTLWLKTEKIADRLLRRGIWEEPPPANRKDGWFFKSTQAAYTTTELFGGVEGMPSGLRFTREQADKVLKEGRTNGMLVRKDGENKDVSYIRQLSLHHETGWGAMDCHVLVSRDPLAGILNDAFFSVIEGSINESVVSNSERISMMISLFDDPKNQKGSTSGSREALVILPFDPCLVFARIVPLFRGLDTTISTHPMLIEHPSRAQTHYPSANGVFQTCFARSSSVQAFATQWASDYQLTAVDIALEELELEVFGLNSSDSKNKKLKRGCWGDETDYPSYFMLPIYFGSLPLFCLALKFPKPFDPKTTSFDVFYSTLKSLHDDILVLLTDESVRITIVRPWIQACLEADWSNFPRYRDVSSKLEIVDRYLFGREKTESTPQDYWLGDSTQRTGGVLGREWKSWVLGLPSYPIKEMAAVKAMNSRLRSIWEKEKKVAILDSALRISLWFEEGRFFEDVPGGVSGHEAWFCNHHLDRLRAMFRILGYSGDLKSGIDESWLPAALAFLRNGKKSSSKVVCDYFGQSTLDHFLFVWMIAQLSQLNDVQSDCLKRNVDCDPNFAQACPRTKGPFANLKAVFCKTRANKGVGVRFTSGRLHRLLQAATVKMTESGMNTEIPIIVVSGNEEFDEPADFPSSAFFSDKDPSIVLAELAHSLRSQSLLEKIILNYEGNFNSKSFSVTLKLKKSLSEKVGGNKCEEASVLLDAFCKITEFETTAPISLYGHLELAFKFTVNRDEQTITFDKK
ncbi:MAG: class I SAM-dependent methyltransferase [Verrucomicrobia bacterium]|nr:MAG: class I SAM-dependent methyltransferase [Verrucomicrobiota bacterium]